MSLPQHMRADDPAAADAARRRLLQHAPFSRFPSLPSLHTPHPTALPPVSSDLSADDILVDDAHLSRPPHDTDVYRWAVLYENQRGITLFSTPFYSPLSLLPSDPPPFTTPDTHSARRHLPSLSLDHYPLPDGTWRWVSTAWMIDMRSDLGEVQHDGFEYNWLFRDKHWHANVGKLSAGAWVRRRRWVRLMMRPANHPHLRPAIPLSPSPSAPSLVSPPSRLSLAGPDHPTPYPWDGSEQDWQHVRRLLKQLGRDGRKLELWRMWLGPHAQSHPPDIGTKGKLPDAPSSPSQNALEKRLSDVVPEGNLPPLVHLITIFRNQGDAVLRSFVFPDSRAQFVRLVREAGLAQDLKHGLGHSFSAVDVDFWSYANDLDGPLTGSSMTLSPSPPSKPAPSWKATCAAAVQSVCDDPGHPVQIALRTYSLCLALSLGPALLPFISALVGRPKGFGAHARPFLRALSRELRLTGFAPAMTVAVAGGTALQQLCDVLAHQSDWVRYISSKLPPYRRAFLANAATSTLAVTLLRRRTRRQPGKPSPTLDLSVLFLVRALDALVQAFLFQRARETAAREVRSLSDDGVTARPSDTGLFNERRGDLAREWQKKATTRLDALVFWACSARIMWCFFYQPLRLPLSYVKWISSLANVDKRLLEVLRALRNGSWSYVRGSTAQRDIVCRLAEELGHPPSWGDPTLLPAYGADFANKAWRRLGVNARRGVGGLPCELVHGDVGAKFGLHSSCVSNTIIRAIHAFAKALVVYVPVHFLPALLANPMSILRPRRALCAFQSAIQSATFLSAFLSSFWFAVCFTRTLALARLFPKVSHDVWDGPCGCILAGSLVCGTSIWIENARRRGEIALYVLPKALRASMSGAWLRSRHPVIPFAECLTFVLSLASLLTLSVHQPESLRGLSRWTLAFVMKGPTAGFWKKRRREITTCPPMSADPPSSLLVNPDYHED